MNALLALSAGRLEEFDEVARRINQPDLGATGSGHYFITTELHAFGAKSRCFRVEIRNLQFNPIPAAGHRLGTIGQPSSTRTLRAAEQQAQIVASHGSERRGRV
jgi:hypothetical protein